MKKTYTFLILSLYFNFINAQQNWTTISTETACTARHECGFVSHQDQLYLIGGRGIKPIDVFNVVTQNWIALENTPFEVHHITPLSVIGSIYIVGGFTGNYPNETPLTHVFKVNPEANSWEAVLEIPSQRRRGAAGVTVYKDKIYIANGITEGHTKGTTFMFDVYDPKQNTWTILPDAPTIRDHSSAAVVDNKLVVLGGRNTSYHEADNFEAFFGKVNPTVDYFEFSTEKWSTYEAELPAPSAGGGCVVLNDKIVFIGGETENKAANTQAYVFDSVSETWSQMPSLQVGRHGTNAVVHNNQIYMAAGCGNQGGSPELNSIEVFK
ncbi:Kelch repeat-containing protein [Gelidibacter salicanalis]|uniref:Galactose oxidase n=1 Tax=Gelidibacter salicanalis TaxID=291193 RepID=A0A934KKD8_9FLAO|nr:kelch repeat-containing protein [Gelidibacter salicanalis]MBJ7880687.1 galactose oxidase [Gelidibacter salicanalis]